VRTHGCSRAQGFLLGRPLPADETEALIDASLHIGRNGRTIDLGDRQHPAAELTGPESTQPRVA
jgi:hypothetical protein